MEPGQKKSDDRIRIGKVSSQSKDSPS
ncbi:protein of unknown function [Cyanobium sp. NIES-981]|nr:protein of unknown function [Cyanobium sp. NIES-981]